MKGMSIICMLMPSDGEDFGESIIIDAVVVFNAVFSVFIGVILTLGAGMVEMSFICGYVFISIDVDGDMVSY